MPPLLRSLVVSLRFSDLIATIAELAWQRWRKGQTGRARRAASSSPEATFMSNRLLVLVVDDDRDVRESLAALLRAQGHEAAVAGDGHEAVRSAFRDCPDVVLLDVGLPGMDGYEVGRALKEARP